MAAIWIREGFRRSGEGFAGVGDAFEEHCFGSTPISPGAVEGLIDNHALQGFGIFRYVV